MPFDSSGLAADTDTSDDAQLPVEGEQGAAPADAEPKLSRRESAALEEIKKSQEERFSKFDAEVSKIRDDSARKDAEIARLQGIMESQERLRQENMARERQASRPDPDRLLGEANDALQKGDLTNYHKKLFEAQDARLALSYEMEQQQRQVQQQQFMPPQARGPQIDPQQAVAMQSEMTEILRDNPRLRGQPNWFERLLAEDRALMLDGIQDGPARWRQAAKQIEARLPGDNKKPTFSRGGKNGFLEGGGHTQGQADGEDEGSNLSDIQKEMAKKAGMSLKEYAHFSKPGSEVYKGKW